MLDCYLQLVQSTMLCLVVLDCPLVAPNVIQGLGDLIDRDLVVENAQTVVEPHER